MGQAHDGIVERGNYFKFSQSATLLEALLDTKSKLLVEASPTDRIWGIGYSMANASGKEDKWGDNRSVIINSQWAGRTLSQSRMGAALTRARNKIIGERSQS
jgi:ribA/ribD-fused uncharacterized protein